MKASIEVGGLNLDDIDYVILSHVHWDNIGTASDFSRSHFIVGNGFLKLLHSGGDPSKTGSPLILEEDLLPTERTIELPHPSQKRSADKIAREDTINSLATSEWPSIDGLPEVIGIFSGGSLFIVNAPGHLDGQIKLLARIGKQKWVYLAGDACHDRRILQGKRGIAVGETEWCDMLYHVDRHLAADTMDRIRALEARSDEHFEVILAHDTEWLNDTKNKSHFWPRQL